MPWICKYDQGGHHRQDIEKIKYPWKLFIIVYKRNCQKQHSDHHQRAGTAGDSVQYGEHLHTAVSTPQDSGNRQKPDKEKRRCRHVEPLQQRQSALPDTALKKENQNSDRYIHQMCHDSFHKISLLSSQLLKQRTA